MNIAVPQTTSSKVAARYLSIGDKCVAALALFIFILKPGLFAMLK